MGADRARARRLPGHRLLSRRRGGCRARRRRDEASLRGFDSVRARSRAVGGDGRGARQRPDGARAAAARRLGARRADRRERVRELGEAAYGRRQGRGEGAQGADQGDRRRGPGQGSADGEGDDRRAGAIGPAKLEVQPTRVEQPEIRSRIPLPNRVHPHYALESSDFCSRAGTFSLLPNQTPNGSSASPRPPPLAPRPPSGALSTPAKADRLQSLQAEDRRPRRSEESRLQSDIGSIEGQIRDARSARSAASPSRLDALEHDLVLQQERLNRILRLFQLPDPAARLPSPHEYNVSVRRLNVRLIELYECEEPSTLDVFLSSSKPQRLPRAHRLRPATSARRTRGSRTRSRDAKDQMHSAREKTKVTKAKVETVTRTIAAADGGGAGREGAPADQREGPVAGEGKQAGAAGGGASEQGRVPPRGRRDPGRERAGDRDDPVGRLVELRLHAVVEWADLAGQRAGRERLRSALGPHARRGSTSASATGRRSTRRRAGRSSSPAGWAATGTS